MSTNILGISAFYHDSAAALIRDGEIISAAQEERFSRIKGDAEFPRNAIQYCLDEGGITAVNLDYAVFYERPMSKFERLLETYLEFAPSGFRSFRKALPLWATQKLNIPGEIAEQLGKEFSGQICFTEHHESHAASAFYPSPFEESAILTLDAVGEWATSSIGTGRGNRVNLTHEMRFPHSLGMLYSAFTYYIGFEVNSGEYKLMGLAPYGKPRYVDIITDNIVDIKDDGSLWMDMSYFNYCQGLTMTSERFHELLGGQPRQPESVITQKHMDIAASIQVVCEEVMLRAARYVHGITGMKNLVMAGGVALNCVANGRVLREGPFENVWVQPASGDAGGALGAALLVWHQLLGNPRDANPHDSQKGSLLGPQFGDEIRFFLDGVGARYESVDDESELLDRVARLLDEEMVVGWFQGRMEYGPRALGARSIIGDPRSPRMQQTMNLKVKFRESFRPFAPCVLQELSDDVFEMRPNDESPYMLFVAPVAEKWRVPLEAEERERMMNDPDLRVRVSIPRSKVPAITHVDYSARIQTVDPERHKRFYRLMRRFYELTECPLLVNTSFNIRGEPIVCTPEDAYRCFMATDIDCLVLGDYILMKDAQPLTPTEDAAAYKAAYALD